MVFRRKNEIEPQPVVARRKLEYEAHEIFRKLTEQTNRVRSIQIVISKNHCGIGDYHYAEEFMIIKYGIMFLLKKTSRKEEFEIRVSASPSLETYNRHQCGCPMGKKLSVVPEEIMPQVMANIDKLMSDVKVELDRIEMEDKAKEDEARREAERKEREFIDAWKRS